MSTQWLARPVVVVDTETTGKVWSTAMVVELAVGVWRPWLGTDRPDRFTVKSWLVKPAQPIPAEATAVHQITNEMVARAPCFDAVARDLQALLGDLDAPVFAAYHAPYDASVLACEFARHGVELPSWLHLFGHRPPWVDPLPWVRHLHPYARGPGRYKLENVARRLGVARGEAHRAAGDVETTAHVLQRLVELGRLPHDLEELLIQQELLAACQEVSFLEWRSRQPARSRADV